MHDLYEIMKRLWRNSDTTALVKPTTRHMITVYDMKTHRSRTMFSDGSINEAVYTLGNWVWETMYEFEEGT